MIYEKFMRVLVGIEAIHLLAVVLVAIFSYWRQKGKQKVRTGVEPIAGSVSVIVPTFNEESSIGSCLESILASNHALCEVIIADDGSTDMTRKVIADNFQDSRIILLTLPHRGKAVTLNSAIDRATSKVLVIVDADTRLRFDAISLLVKHFEMNERLGAVSGNRRLEFDGRKLVNYLQEIEHIVGSNLNRHFTSFFGYLINVSGAIGAYRRKALLSVGCYSTDTVSEDTDVTISLCEAGWQMVYEPRALAWTSPGESLRVTSKQHSRWQWGTLQVLYKHRGSLFSPRTGLFGLLCFPYFLCFRIFIPALLPLLDWGFILLPRKSQRHALSLVVTYHLEQVLLYEIGLCLDGASPWFIIGFPIHQLIRRQYYLLLAVQGIFRSASGRKPKW
ncbi:MAG TPA: glycosyltransferase family 2 protein [Bellilinea sp.]|nr:glycosyltransferase family 2 protein [Bellilinea sp.]